MKNALTALFFFIALALLPSGASHAQYNDGGGESPLVAYGTEVPFPFGTEIPFPWGTIEGVWEVQDGALQVYFSFQVRRDTDGTKVLRVLQVDRKTRQVTGVGAGFANLEQKVIRAVMRGSVSKNSYLVFVRAFLDSSVDRQMSSGVSPTTTVLTIREFGNTDLRDQHYILRKVTARPFDERKLK